MLKAYHVRQCFSTVGEGGGVTYHVPIFAERANSCLFCPLHTRMPPWCSDFADQCRQVNLAP